MAAIRGQGLRSFLGGGQNTNFWSLQAGQAMMIPPGNALVTSAPAAPAFPSTIIQSAGEYLLNLGPYTRLQYWDPVLQNWRFAPYHSIGQVHYVDSDGVNWRVVNTSGCCVGAIVYTAGSGYTAPTVTATGGSKWIAIVGGLISTVVPSPASAGSGMSYPPICNIPAPSAPGVQATAHAVLTNGALSLVVVDNQGAGYSGAVSLTFAADPRDPSTSLVLPSAITLTITGSGTIAAILCTDPGLPQTSVPTLTITDATGSSAAAAALMDFSVTGYTVSTAGGALAAGSYITSSGGIYIANAAAYTNPAIQTGIVLPRPCKIIPTLSSGGIVASASTAPIAVEDWGSGFQAAPTPVIVNATAVAATGPPAIAFTVGGQTDFVWMQATRA